MRTLFIAAALGLAACAFAQEAPKKPPVEVDVRLEPGKVHEECMKLAKGEAKKFEWTSDAAVDFNIHYHRGSDAFYPFKANNRKAAKARFIAEHGDDYYCWMWIAKKDPASVKGKIGP